VIYINYSLSDFPRKLSHCAMHGDAHSPCCEDARLCEDSTLPASQLDLSCCRVSAFQELLRWKEKQHMLEMQTCVINFINGTADEKYIRNESVIYYELGHLPVL